MVGILLFVLSNLFNLGLADESLPVAAGPSESDHGRPVVGSGSQEILSRLREEGFSLSGGYYEVLGVDRGASRDQILTRYRRVALIMAPVFGSEEVNPELNRVFTLFAEAWEVLGDDRKRERYDRFGGEGRSFFGDGAESVENYGRFRSIFDSIVGTGGLAADSWASSLLHFWTRLMHLASIRRIFREVIEGRTSASLGVRATALQYVTYFLALPEFQTLILNQIREFPFDPASFETFLAALSENLERAGEPIRPFAARVVGALVSRSEGSQRRFGSENRASLLGSLGRFARWSPLVHQRLWSAARSRHHSERLEAVRSLLAYFPDEFRTESSRRELRRAVSTVVRTARRAARGLNARGAVDLQEALEVQIAIDSLESEHPYEPPVESPFEPDDGLADTSETSVSAYLTTIDVPRELSYAMVPASLEEPDGPLENAAAAVERAALAAGLPAGTGPRLLAARPDVQAKVVRTAAQAAAVAQRAFERALERGLRGFGGSCNVVLSTRFRSPFAR